MSEGPQRQHQYQRASRNMVRAERTTTSCGECRRRKQKCDQEQPCGNCLRRFPVPVCEYRIGNRIPGTSTFLTPARAGGRVPFHPTLPGVNSPLLQAGQSPGTTGHSPVGGANWVISGNTTSHSSPGTDCSMDPSINDAPWLVTQPLDESNDAPIAVSSSSAPAPAPWFPLADPKRSSLNLDTTHASQQVLTYRLAVPDLVFDITGEEDDDGGRAPADDAIPRRWHNALEPRLQHPERPVGGVDEQIAHLPVAQTTLNKKLLRIYITVLSRFKASLNGDPEPNNPFIRYYSPFCLQDPLVMKIILYTSACFLHETGHVRTTALRTIKGHAIRMLNESLRSNDVGSRRHQSLQNTTGTALETTTDGGGGGSISSSNGRSEHPSDAAIAGVIQLTVAEWYWGESEEDLRYHLRGLRGMIRLRGGFNKLGMNGLLAKNAIIHDVSISLAHEKSPLLLTLSSSDDSRGGGDGSQEIESQARRSQGGVTAMPATASDPWGLTGYDFANPIKDLPLRMAHMTPLVSYLPSSFGLLPSFVDCAASLGMHPATASILDNVRYLFSAVEAIYTTASETITSTSTAIGTTATSTSTSTSTPTPAQASRKARLTGKYMHEHISGLHPTIPGCRQALSPEASTRTSPPSSSSNYFAAADDGSVRSGSISSTGTTGRGSVGTGRSPSGPASDSTTTPEWPQAHDASESPTSPRPMQHHHHHHHNQQQQQLQQKPDFMHQVIRMTAIVYTRAIATGTPLSVACTESEFLQIWTTTWRVPLSTWNSAVGVFHWVMLAIAPACHRTPHARFVKNMTTISTLTLGVENWAIAMSAARAGMRLQYWLGGQDVEGDVDEGQ
ncbi:Putative zn(2)Cys(6) fungal-type DNA-binding domain, fungal transcription factor [Colletotrichum destructivum]|uniref:Zn(2)Cys(6) fungal-type DNA-binding domain, fungal transcription factor n=1 Tax=Colletotrichum destructivum TaxID=34406 RepID=A0AAX4J0N5_9PEZI|nr:Putative zn(2)Cys(6) fungal-type DNA-binding domain, fungal transcription factor [Colletotrichum destructivum]